LQNGKQCDKVVFTGILNSPSDGTIVTWKVVYETFLYVKNYKHGDRAKL